MKLFEGNSLKGKVGVYPLTAENLLRVGLALCTYLKLQRGMGEPLLATKDLNFVTLSISLGFMAGGGNVIREGAKVGLRWESNGEEGRLIIEGMEEYEIKMVESIMFSRYNMPRAEGEEVGKIWIQENSL